jgi:hypothetical protein
MNKETAFVLTIILTAFTGLFAYIGHSVYNDPENVEYREIRTAVKKAGDDTTTVNRYKDNIAGNVVREFTAHDGKLLCVATSNRSSSSGDTVTCVINKHDY